MSGSDPVWNSEAGQFWLRRLRLNDLLRPGWAPYFSWSPREVSKRRRPRLRRSARSADYPAVLESVGGRRKLAALRQSTTESPARSCAHRRRNGGLGSGWRELVETAGKPERLRCSRPRTQHSNPRHTGEGRYPGFWPQCHRSTWIPAYAGMTLRVERMGSALPAGLWCRRVRAERARRKK